MARRESDITACWRMGNARPVRASVLEAGDSLSIPNLITLGRILLVPIVVWAITLGEMRIAFALFLAAGLNDARDGFLAQRLHQENEPCAYLHPPGPQGPTLSLSF